MVNAVNSAISAKADGIAVSLIDPTAFNAPVKSALAAGIPVVAYNADVEPPSNERLAYIGQNLELAGRKDGRTHRRTRAVRRSRAVHRDAGLG